MDPLLVLASVSRRTASLLRPMAKTTMTRARKITARTAIHTTTRSQTNNGKGDSDGTLYSEGVSDPKRGISPVLVQANQVLDAQGNSYENSDDSLPSLEDLVKSPSKKRPAPSTMELPMRKRRSKRGRF